MDLCSDASTAERSRQTSIYQCSSPISLQGASPQSSVFSCDAVSSQRSVTPASSNSSGEWENAGVLAALNNQQYAVSALSTTSADVPIVDAYTAFRYEPRPQRPAPPSSPRLRPQQEVPLSSRQNPRRSRPQLRTDSSDGGSGVLQPRPPPALVRQEGRKDSFVDSLVGELVYGQIT